MIAETNSASSKVLARIVGSQQENRIGLEKGTNPRVMGGDLLPPNLVTQRLQAVGIGVGIGYFDQPTGFSAVLHCERLGE